MYGVNATVKRKKNTTSNVGVVSTVTKIDLVKLLTPCKHTQLFFLDRLCFVLSFCWRGGGASFHSFSFVLFNSVLFLFYFYIIFYFNISFYFFFIFHFPLFFFLSDLAAFSLFCPLFPPFIYYSLSSSFPSFTLFISA